MQSIKNKIIIGVVSFAAIGCTDSFLKEEMVSTITQEYFNSEKGLNELIVGTYNANRVDWGYQEGYYMNETGHDACMTTGDANLNQFSTSVWSSTGTVGSQANNYMGYQSKQQEGFLINHYPIIDNCNKAIQTIRSGAAVGKYATDPDYAAQRLSEALFNRAYAYYQLNTIFGDVYFSTISITRLPDNFQYSRTPAAVMWRELIGDLRYAVEHLPPTYADSEYGRATKYAAAHLLARMYLNRYQGKDYGTKAYGRNADGAIDTSNPESYLGMLYKGDGAADLDSAIYYATLVIDAHPLVSDYRDLFPKGIGDFSCEGTTENVLSAIFSESGDNYRYGCRTIRRQGGVYVNERWGIPDYCWEYSVSPSFGLRNNDFGLDVFTDKVNDSRFQKSFRLEYVTAAKYANSTVPADNIPYPAYNNAGNKTFTWTNDQATYFNTNILPNYTRASWGGRQAVTGEHKMGTGDLAFAILENTKATAITVEEAEAQPFVLFARWMKDGTKYLYRPEIIDQTTNYKFKESNNFYGLERGTSYGVPGSIKFDDPNRLAPNTDYGGRDVPIFRSSEMYLVRAEAYGRKGDFGNALNDINALRERAAFKAGEARNEVIARLYPGHENLTTAEQQYPYKSTVGTYDKIKADVTYWDGSSAKSVAEMYHPQANTPNKRFLEFIYNEYAREFNQEGGLYYSILHHAGVQAPRIQWHSQLGANPQNTSYAAGSWDVADNVSGTNGQNGQAKGGFQNYMTLKPFSNAFMSMLTDANGNLLDQAGKKAYQNYGY